MHRPLNNFKRNNTSDLMQYKYTFNLQTIAENPDMLNILGMPDHVPSEKRRNWVSDKLGTFVYPEIRDNIRFSHVYYTVGGNGIGVSLYKTPQGDIRNETTATEYIVTLPHKIDSLCRILDDMADLYNGKIETNYIFTLN